MAPDVEGAVGAPVLVCTKVNPRGWAASLGGGVRASGQGPLVDGLSSAILQTKFRSKASKQKQSAVDSTAPDFGRTAYLVVTEDEVVLLQLIPKGLTGKLGDVVGRVPRREVVDAEFESSAMYASGITLAFADGTRWVLEAPRPDRKKAQQIVELFAAEPSRSS